MRLISSFVGLNPFAIENVLYISFSKGQVLTPNKTKNWYDRANDYLDIGHSHESHGDLWYANRFEITYIHFSTGKERHPTNMPPSMWAAGRADFFNKEVSVHIYRERLPCSDLKECERWLYKELKGKFRVSQYTSHEKIQRQNKNTI